MRIIADSMCDLSQQEAGDLGVTVLPLNLRFGTEEYRDGVDITMVDFYERLKTVEELPKTSAVSPESFAKAFEKALSEGEEILCVTGSSCLSSCYQSACIARDMIGDERIHVVDSMNASHGFWLLLTQAIRMRDEGRSASEIAEELTRLVPRVRMTGMATTMKYLVMGGRVTNFAGMIGSVLNLKPMVTLTDGYMRSAGIVHGAMKAKRWFADKLREYPADPAYPMAFAAAYDNASRDALCDDMKAAGVTTGDIRFRQIGPVIGTHTGPGLLSIGWIEKE